MTSKERLRSALNFEEPDRVPIVANLTPQVAENLGKVMNLPYEAEDSFLSTRISHTEILLELGNDDVLIGACRDKKVPTILLDNGHLKDEWDLEYASVGIYMDIIERPLGHVTTIEELDASHSKNVCPDNYQGKHFFKTYCILHNLKKLVFEYTVFIHIVYHFFM
jgi:uroporphyrinogen decarboxylase